MAGACQRRSIRPTSLTRSTCIPRRGKEASWQRTLSSLALRLRQPLRTGKIRCTSPGDQAVIRNRSTLKASLPQTQPRPHLAESDTESRLSPNSQDLPPKPAPCRSSPPRRNTGYGSSTDDRVASVFAQIAQTENVVPRHPLPEKQNGPILRLRLRPENGTDRGGNAYAGTLSRHGVQKAFLPSRSRRTVRPRPL